MGKRALVLLADGFEEVEALAPVDVLRRADVEVVTAGVPATDVTSARGVRVRADVSIESALTGAYDAVVLPGGTGGAQAMAASGAVRELLLRAAREQWWIAALCASPALVLSPLGLLQGRRATCYPSLRESLDAAFVTDGPVEIDGGVITGTGPGTSLLFSLAVAEVLVGKARTDAIATAMLVAR